MSPRDKRDVTDLHRQLMDRFPHAFPKDYDALRPLKLGIHADILHRWPEVDPVLLRRALANHTRRDGYLLALLHHRGDRRYDLDGQPVGTVTEAERAEAARLPGSLHPARASPSRTGAGPPGPRGEAPPAARARTAQPGSEGRRKAEHERVQQEIAARKAALIAQGIMPESRAERKRRLAREAAERAARRPHGPTPARDRPAGHAIPRSEPRPVRPEPTPDKPAARAPYRGEPEPARPMPQVEFRKKRRVPPPDEK